MLYFQLKVNGSFQVAHIIIAKIVKRREGCGRRSSKKAEKGRGGKDFHEFSQHMQIRFLMKMESEKKEKRKTRVKVVATATVLSLFCRCAFAHFLVCPRSFSSASLFIFKSVLAHFTGTSMLIFLFAIIRSFLSHSFAITIAIC